MCVGMLTFWAFVIGAICYAVTHTTRHDIDRDEYATRRDALHGGASQDRTSPGTGDDQLSHRLEV
jgi:hypothetical protein